MKNMAAVAPYSGPCWRWWRGRRGQAGGAFAIEFQIGAHHLLLAQEFGQRQHDVGGGDAGLARPVSPRRRCRAGASTSAAQHHVLRFQAAHADGDHAQRIDVRVWLSVPTRCRGRPRVLSVDHRRHLLQVDLVHDAVAGRDHVDILEGLLGPVDEVEAVFVAAIFDGAVLLEGLRIEAAAFHRQRVVRSVAPAPPD
jgi:hypothetical protein